jgi:hypothetical protein
MGNNGNKALTPTVDYGKFDLTNIDNYEDDYELPWSSRIEKIYELPGLEDMAGVVLRGIFKNERQLNAVLRLAYRHRKFGDTNHQELLRMKIAGTAAIGGVGRLDALFAATNLVASDMYRTARNMPKLKKGEQEQIHRGSDFREYQRNDRQEGPGN